MEKTGTANLTSRGIKGFPLGGVRILGQNGKTPKQYLDYARGLEGVMVINGPKGTTSGGIIQRLLSPEIRGMIAGKLDVVLVVRDSGKDKKGKAEGGLGQAWMRSFIPTEAFPRLSTGDITMVGIEEGNLIFKIGGTPDETKPGEPEKPIDGVIVRVVEESTFKADKSINDKKRPSVLIDYPDDNMEQLTPYLPYVNYILKAQVIKGKNETVEDVKYDVKDGPVMQARLKEDKISETKQRIFTSLSCTTTFTSGFFGAADSILGIERIKKNSRMAGFHTFTSEKTLPFDGRFKEEETGATKATGRVFPKIKDWGNFTGSVKRINMDEPSVASLFLELEVRNPMTPEGFKLAMLNAALTTPWLVGIIDYSVFPTKEQGLSLALREAPNRAVIDINKVRWDDRTGRLDLIDGEYSNVQSFNNVMLEGALKLLAQQGVKIETDVFERSAPSLAVMGPDALAIAIEKQMEVVAAETAARAEEAAKTKAADGGVGNNYWGHWNTD